MWAISRFRTVPNITADQITTCSDQVPKFEYPTVPVQDIFFFRDTVRVVKLLRIC